MIYRILLIHLLLLVSCKTGLQEQQVTYKPYHFLYRPSSNERIRKIQSLVASLDDNSSTTFLSFDSSWQFSFGDSLERIKAVAKTVTGKRINLPHRIERPNTPFWYTREIDIKAKGIIAIHADDGAQLFLNGKQVHRLKGIYFSIDTIGNVVITIRVLNNAMSGGLRKVIFLTSEQFKESEDHKNNNIRLKKLAEKIILLNQPSTKLIDLVERAFELKNEASIKNAEKAFESFPFFTGPWLQVKNNNQWIISLLTDNEFPVTLAYGEHAERLENKMMQSGDVISFKLNLQPGRKYFYQLRSKETVSPIYDFETSTSSSFSFTTWADSQSGWNVFQQNILNTLDQNDAFSIGVGDLVSEGADMEEWRMFFNTLSPSSAEMPYYLIAGNHDYDGYYDDLQPVLYKKFLNHANASYFSWKHGNCAFIALDPNEVFPIGIHKGTSQYAWFHKQLQSSEWKQATWRFVLLHQPPYSQGWLGYEGDKTIRDLLEPVIEKAKIDFVISGHTHDYERLTKFYGKQKTTYLILGGAGGSLEPLESSLQPQMDTVIKTHHMGRFYVSDKDVSFKVFDLTNKVIDSVLISK